MVPAEQNTQTYRQLSPRLSQLLYCLAVIERKKERATRQKLALMMDVSLSNISYLVNQLKKQPVLYLKSHPDEGELGELASTTRRPGRLPEAYYLNIETV